MPWVKKKPPNTAKRIRIEANQQCFCWDHIMLVWRNLDFWLYFMCGGKHQFASTEAPLNPALIVVGDCLHILYMCFHPSSHFSLLTAPPDSFAFACLLSIRPDCCLNEGTFVWLYIIIYSCSFKLLFIVIMTSAVWPLQNWELNVKRYYVIIWVLILLPDVFVTKKLSGLPMACFLWQL